MTDQLRDLLDDAVADVEPADRLGEIRARTARPPRRSWRYAVGGAVLATAATVAAVVVLTGDAEGPTPRPTQDLMAAPSALPGEPEVRTLAVPVYFVGDSPAGPRLFREFRRVPEFDPASAAAALVGSGDALDADYRTLWPAGWGAWHVDIGDDGRFAVPLPDATWTERPAGMSAEEAELAVQQLVRTLQGSTSSPAAVAFSLGGRPAPILGIQTTAAGLTAAPGLDQLSLVSISDPTEGRVTDGTFSARGVASAPEGNVVLSLERDGETVWEQPVVAEGVHADRLSAWSLEDIDVAGFEPGRYTFVATVEGPGPENQPPELWTDTRSLIVG
ncbi:Gmad2 immunoglobulin-like domain-containing protein [Nocardioides sp. W7]|uniref:Gmad2 immunoglobulin-like domain-containing protein n=1 Tax=Nocardioides sp. W7 TaxID=2931390 RepID=UPI001FD0D36D|nr:Gmad2 immunoglobulin-like domain-containing protein [Nocardioides sp. W7]